MEKETGKRPQTIENTGLFNGLDSVENVDNKTIIRKSANISDHYIKEYPQILSNIILKNLWI